MKTIFAIIVLLGISSQAFAGHVKLTWNNSKQAPGEAFRVYWSVKNSDQKGLIDLGRVQPKKSKSEKMQITMANDEWQPGQEVCFRMSAYNIAGDQKLLESDPSNPACKIMSPNGTIVPQN